MLLSVNQVSLEPGSGTSLRSSWMLYSCVGISAQSWVGASRLGSGSEVARFRAVGTWKVILAGFKSRVLIVYHMRCSASSLEAV